jgi:hypothetical protein
MTVCATDVVAPMLAAPEVIVLFPAGMAVQTGFRDFFRGLVLEGDYLSQVTAALNVILAWAMAGFAPSDFVLPAAYLCKVGMRSVREGFELIFVTVFAGFAADVISGTVAYWFGLAWLNGL